MKRGGGEVAKRDSCKHDRERYTTSSKRINRGVPMVLMPYSIYTHSYVQKIGVGILFLCLTILRVATAGGLCTRPMTGCCVTPVAASNHYYTDAYMFFIFIFSLFSIATPYILWCTPTDCLWERIALGLVFLSCTKSQ